MLVRIHRIVPFLTVLTALSIGSFAAADILRLKGGGEVRGSLEGALPGRSAENVNDKPQLVLKTPAGARVTVQRSEIGTFEQRPAKVEEYERRARAVADDVNARWELAEWCRRSGLKAQREEQLRLILELDPEHEKAHYGLGHSQLEGKWISRDDALRERGFVEYKGRVVSQEELRILKEAEAVRGEERQWFKQVRLWLGWLNGTNAERSRRGFDELQGITDPNAVRALANFLSNDDDERVRGLYVSILRNIPGPKPVPLLVETSLHDASSQIRAEALSAVSKTRRDAAQPYYVRALNNAQNDVVRRAGAALQEIGDETAVPALVEALVTTHRYRVKTIDQSSAISFSTGGSFGPGVANTKLPPEVEAGLRTGQYPNGVIIDNSRLPPPPTRYVTVRRNEQNPEVLAALQKLTGESFGYEKSAWRLWWNARKNGAAPKPASP